MTGKTVEKDLNQPVGQLLLWTGFLLPPVAWSVCMEAMYLFSDYGCANNDFIFNHIVTAVFLLLSLMGWAVAWSNWQNSGALWPNGSSGALPRSRFMSALGLLTGPLFSALIFAQWLPTAVGVPCGK